MHRLETQQPVLNILHSSLDEYRTAPYCIIPILWVLMLLETLVCNEYNYLSNLGDLVNVKEFIQTLRATRPSVSFSSESYHYETRYRTVYYTDSNGKSQTRTESYQEIVVTHTDAMSYQFEFHDDISKDTLEVKPVFLFLVSMYFFPNSILLL